MALAGVARRQQSDWMCEAIINFKSRDPMYGSVGAGEDLEVFDAIKGITLSDKAMEAMAAAISMLRAHDPEMEGVRAAVIRAAIRAKLETVERQPQLDIQPPVHPVNSSIRRKQDIDK